MHDSVLKATNYKELKMHRLFQFPYSLGNNNNNNNNEPLQKSISHEGGKRLLFLTFKILNYFIFIARYKKLAHNLN